MISQKTSCKMIDAVLAKQGKEAVARKSGYQSWDLLLKKALTAKHLIPCPALNWYWTYKEDCQGCRQYQPRKVSDEK